MNIATAIVLALLLVLALLAVRIIRKRRLLFSCGGDCAHCCANCHKRSDHQGVQE